MSNVQTLGEEAVRKPSLHEQGRRIKRRLTDYIPYLLILSLLIPYRIEVGPLLLSPNRIFLLLVLIPCLFTIMSGGLGRLRTVDVLIFAHVIWMTVAYFIAHGFADGAEPVGIRVVEVMGSYLVARLYIRSAEAFRNIVKMLFISVVIMLPLLLAEAVTGDHYLNRLFALAGPAMTPHFMEPRLGLDRAFGVFVHPILLGVYCISVFSLTYYVLGYGSRRITALFRTGLVGVGMACSLSAGPLLAGVIQSLLIAWDRLTRTIQNRWLVLSGSSVFIWVLIDILSNRTPFHVIVDYLTFNTGSAYNRILIWHFGSAEVARHPIFGIGLSEWERPYWMSGSMDNFWLVLAVQGGVPALLFFAGAVLALCISVGRLRLTDPRLISCRRGWMITIVGLALAGATVHYYKTIFCLLMFIIGSIVWMLDANQRVAARTPVRPSAARRAAPGTIQLG
ncbi:MAG: O-antigen ligase family protein [Alphaproteobacteria bacterium]